MAKLGKGILGAPTGVIGNVMCYNRLGKSIIQSRSYPVDAYHRRWNLVKARLSSRLSFVFFKMPAFWSARWATDAPMGLSGLDYFLLYNLSLLYSLKASSVFGAALFTSPPRNPYSFTISGKWFDDVLYINVPSDDPFWQLSGDVFASVLLFKNSLSFVTASVNFGSVSNVVLPVPISPAQWGLNVSLSVILYHASPSAPGYVYSSGLFSPDAFL